MINVNLDIARLSATHNPDNAYITISITPGESYEGFLGDFAILRGRYGYKHAPSDEHTKVILLSSDEISEFDIIDDSVEPGILYYYSIVFLIDDGAEGRWEYNPNYHMVSAFGNKYMSYRDSIFKLLPSGYTEGDNGTLYNYISVLSYPLEIARTEIDIRIMNNNPYYVDEERLAAYASVVGWSINRELSVEMQREELLRSTPTYQSKGRHSAITDLIHFVTGWNIYIEEGYYRVFTVGDTLVDETDAYAIANVDMPWLPITEQFIGDGSSDQIITLSHNSADRVTVFANDEYWYEVDSLAGVGEEYAYTIVDSGSDRTVLFGDGVDGVRPDGVIAIDYVYGGDTLTYIPDQFSQWRHDTGFRILIEPTMNSVPVNEVYINKVARIVSLFKASYASYVIYLLSSFAGSEVESTFIPTDLSLIELDEYGWFILDSSLMDTETEWLV